MSVVLVSWSSSQTDDCLSIVLHNHGMKPWWSIVIKHIPCSQFPIATPESLESSMLERVMYSEILTISILYLAAGLAGGLSTSFPPPIA